MIKKLFLLLTCMLISICTYAQKIVLLQQGKQSGIRGMSVVNDRVAWISGSNGYTALTTDGGKTWVWQQVKGFEKSDFRSIKAFSDKKAIIMSSGTPALIMKTIDGGKNWQIKYRNSDTTYFLDAMGFDNARHGIALGDPINNKFLLLETNDSGEHWHTFNNLPKAAPNEAAFAASSTCLRVSDEHIRIISGGSISMLHDYNADNKTWRNYTLPIMHGKSSQGAFSFANGHNGLLFVGGDYAHDKITDSVSAVARWQGKSLIISTTAGHPDGYQSCVEYLADNTYLSTGTSGSNITTDGGKTWMKIDDASFNVCCRAKDGKIVLLAGSNGRIAVFEL